MIDAANETASKQDSTEEKETSMDKTAAQSNDLAVRLQGALDQSSTAFMMIDRDFNVTYVNQATMSLLKQHEATFR